MSQGGLSSSGLSRFLPLLVLIALVPLLAACGSSKPSYCSKVSDLKQSVSDLANVKVIQNGTSAVTSAVNKVKDDANAAVSAAKSEFSPETQALTTAVNNLTTSVKNLPTATAATLPSIPGQIQAVSTAVTNLANATKSKCS